MNDILLSFERVGCRVTDSGAPLLEDLTFALREGEAVVLCGQAGCGKSTALRIALGDVVPDSGTATVLGVDPSAITGAALIGLRQRIGYLAAGGNLIANLSLRDNLLLPLLYHRDLPGDEIEGIADDLAHLLGMETIPAITPASAGPELCQLVALGRALALGPRLLLLDEPARGLDAHAEEEMWRLLWRLTSERDLAIVATAAVADRARTLTDRIIALPPRRKDVAERWWALRS